MESLEGKIRKDNILSKESNEDKNYINERWTNGLTLRKRKLNSILSKKRGLEQFKMEGTKDYEIIKEKLNISVEVKNKKYDELEDFLKQMKNHIKSKDINYNKYALYCIRAQTLNNDNLNNKNILSELLYKQDFISDILNLIQNNFDDKQVIFEGLWILINILYYKKDSDELIIFLTQDQCIQLFIKILDKKDNVLRLNVYFLLSNLLMNNNVGLINQVLFHLYMSTLFRLYIFKDLEDPESKLTENELIYLFNILGRLSDFINDTFIDIQNNNISKFTKYNSNVNLEAIIENNNYLSYHSLMLFINNIEKPKLAGNCLYGLAKLTNFLDSNSFNRFFESGISRKLVKEMIKVPEEELLNFAVQIIGNYINSSPEELLDLVFLEETLQYFVKLIQTYPNKQALKRDIFWSTSNITSCNNNYSDLLGKTGMLLLILQSIYSDKELVINEALFVLLGFFDPSNIEFIIKYYHLDYIKNLYLCLKNLHNKSNPGEAYSNGDIIEKILICLGFLFEDGDLLKGNNLPNKFVKDFEKNGGFDLLELMLTQKNNIYVNLVEKLLEFRNH